MVGDKIEHQALGPRIDYGILICCSSQEKFAAENTAPAAKVKLVGGARPPAQPIQAGGAADDQRATAPQSTSPTGLLCPNIFSMVNDALAWELTAFRFKKSRVPC